MKLGIAIATVLLLVGSAGAQPKPEAPKPDPRPDLKPIEVTTFEKDFDVLFVNGGLTSDQAAGRGAKASPNVLKASASIDVSVATAMAAEIARVPRVELSATYTRLSPLDPLVFAPGMELEFFNNSYVGSASVGVALSDYITRYPKLVAGAKLGVEAARAGKQASQLDAALEARLAYYEWVRSKLQVVIAQRQVTQVRATLGQVRALADAQRLSKADLMRVESQEAQAEQVFDQLSYVSELREEQLRILIGAPIGEPLQIGEDIRIEITAPPVDTLADNLSTAEHQRPQFHALDAGIAAKEKQRDAEKAYWYPRLSAFASADYARPNQRIFPQVDEFRLTWQAGLQLSWSINDTMITTANVKRFDAEARELRADRDNLERGTRIQILAAQQAVSLAQKTMITSQKRLAAAEEGYRVRMALLAAQRATAVELVDAETELSRSRADTMDARINLRIALAQLSNALGNDKK